MKTGVLVTGANGFLGRAVSARFREHPGAVRLAVRTRAGSNEATVAIGDIHGATDWRAALEGVDVVVHLAARVHVMRDAHADPLGAFRHVNVDGTRQLAEQAAAAGVRRLVFVSSIKVNGERTRLGAPFRPDDPAHPQGPYAQSKLEAERALSDVSAASGLEVTTVRAPLIYGPGVRANFLAMMRWMHRGLPLPLASVANRRSLVFVDNFADLLFSCATHPAAANQIFLAADGEDLATPDLLCRLARALGVRPRVFPFPLAVLRSMARAIGRSAELDRLCESLQVDITKTRSMLGWTPPHSVDDALQRTARAFLAGTAR